MLWDDQIDGTPGDYADQQALVDEIEARCKRLLTTSGFTLPVNYGSGVIHRIHVGVVDIKWEPDRRLWIDVFTDNDGDRRAYTRNNFINRRLVKTYVLPTLRQAMILDDLIEGVDGGTGDGRSPDQG